MRNLEIAKYGLQVNFQKNFGDLSAGTCGACRYGSFFVPALGATGGRQECKCYAL